MSPSCVCRAPAATACLCMSRRRCRRPGLLGPTEAYWRQTDARLCSNACQHSRCRLGGNFQAGLAHQRNRQTGRQATVTIDSGIEQLAAALTSRTFLLDKWTEGAGASIAVHANLHATEQKPRNNGKLTKWDQLRLLHSPTRSVQLTDGLPGAR